MSEFIESKVEVYTSFDNMNINENILRGIYGYGFEKPSPIQQKAIVPIASGVDVIAQAQSGTGKTATFSIGLLQRMDEKDNSTQGLILSPTRELSFQSEYVIKSLANYTSLKTALFVGGTMVKDDIENLKNNVHVAVGTPGRILDLVKRHKLKLDKLKIVVIDEADEMLSKGFKEQLQDIFQSIPLSTQVCLISATMPNETLELSKKIMKDPVRILVKQEQLTLEGIKQFYVYLDHEQHKFETLADLYENMNIQQAIIYCNSRRRVEDLTKFLNDNDHTVSSIHGETPYAERENIMRQFRSGSSRVLIATDLLSRGIDVQQVSLVVNFDLPYNIECYLHRIGRTGRHGRNGIAINLLSKKDIQTLRDIEKHYDTEIKELPMHLANL